MRTKNHIFLMVLIVLMFTSIIAACNGREVDQNSNDIFSSNTADEISTAINCNFLKAYGFKEIDTGKFIIGEKANNAYELSMDDVCYDYYLSDIGVCGRIETPLYSYYLCVTIYYDKREYMINLSDAIDNKWVHRTYVTDEFKPIPKKNSLFDSSVPVYMETNEEGYNNILSYISLEDIRLVIDQYNNFTYDMLKSIDSE